MHLASTFQLISIRQKSLSCPYGASILSTGGGGDGREEEHGKDVFSSKATDIHHWSNENVNHSCSLRY